MRLSVIATALTLGLAMNLAMAQTSDTPPPPPTQDQDSQGDLTSMKNQGQESTDSAPEKTKAIKQQDTRTGNAQMPQKDARSGDLTSMKNQGKPTTDSAPEKTEMIKRQDSSTGNAQMSHMNGQHADFATLDTASAGYVTKDQAQKDKWLARHFNKCDSDRNGQISQPEYSACTTRGR